MYRKLVISISILIVLLLVATVISMVGERLHPGQLASVPTPTMLQGMSNGATKGATPTVLPVAEQGTPTPEPVVAVFLMYLPIIGTGQAEASLSLGTVNP